MRTYVPLWVKSNFSFLEGASHPGELVERAHELGLPAVALTDRDGVHGLVRAFVRARDLGQKLLHGAQVSVGSLQRLADVVRLGNALEHSATPLQRVVLLAENREGYGRLCRLLTLGRQRCPKGQSLVTPEEVCNMGEGLIALTPDPDLLEALMANYKGRLYGMVARHHEHADLPQERDMRIQGEQLGVPLVAANEVLYHSPARRPLQDILTCIRTSATLSKAGRRIRSNAEHGLRSAHDMKSLFADDVSLLDRTLEVAERCSFSFSQLRYVYPGEQLPEGKSQQDWLRELTLTGACERYGAPLPHELSDAVRRQLESELELIDELDYGGYFLTMWEIVQFCRRESILCQGRGSAANSAVCYCLGITAIDPIHMDLLFERFLSRNRSEPPDIDLDIEHERREEVIQWVYKRYGRRHAAMVANVIRYRARSAVRDVGKALALPQTALDRLSKQMGHYADGLEASTLQAAGLDPESPIHTHFLKLVSEIQDFPRHLSIHPGGFILGSDPVDTIVPIEAASMENRTVIQWDKYDVEDLGLFKVDLLGLGAMTHLRKAFALLRDRCDLELSMATIPPDDPATYDMLCKGDTVGVFQVESRAQMAMLPRLAPRKFYDLVIEVAIVRPGPIQGGMVHPYLRRRQGKEEIELPHPALDKVLGKTLGVPIFQEQVMKLAVAVADYTPGEADQLRRDMAAWRSSGRIEGHRLRLISRMRANGITQEFAERVFEQIRGFGEYGFPESHAASFALIAYATAYLRRHHPAVFSCALLNSLPMGFYSAATIVEDAKRRGVEVRPIDARCSQWDCTLERTHAGRWAIRMGLRFVQGLGARQREKLERASRADGHFRDLDEFVRRTGLNRKSLVALGEAGAFESFTRDATQGGEKLERRDALWHVRGIAKRADDSLPLPDSTPSPSFRDLTRNETILWDYRSSVHSTRGHPMDCVRPLLDAQRIPNAQGIRAAKHGRRVRYVGMVICRQRPGTASGVTFFTLEDETGFVNLVVWRHVFERFAILAKTASILGVDGEIQSAEGVVHLVADRLWEPDFELQPEGQRSRDFH
jgi:error-prone DNA polymerase